MTTVDLSVVVVGSRASGPVPELFSALAPALQSGRVELLLASAQPGASVATANTRWVRCPAGSTVPAMRLAGVRAASAPLIALTEDFCVPGAGWVEALLEAHARDRAAVVGGPIARRAGSAADWALTLIEYGRFFGGSSGGSAQTVSDLPSINVAYPARALFSALPSEQTGIFEVELHARLREAGVRFCLSPAATMFDQNTTQIRPAARAQYHHGRLFGGDRVRGRALALRLKHALLTPAVPAVLLSRIARRVTAAGQAEQLLRSLPALSILLTAWAAGEAMGSMFGPGQSAERWT
ncbi:MAG TPA: hypothetical protein VGJ91_09060 [Polyangiaceae bacterium]|jgi:hypothetical protein